MEAKLAENMPLVAILIIFIALVSLTFFYGYKKRVARLIPPLDKIDIRRFQLVRFLSAFALLSLVFSALFLSFSATSVPKKTGILAFLVDESRSAGAVDCGGVSRIECSKEIVLQLDNFPYTEVAIYGFTDRSFSHSNFSDNHYYFREAVKNLVAIEAVPGSGTDLGFSVLNFLEDLADKRGFFDKKPVLIVIVSDGENIGESEMLKRAIRNALKYKVKIIAVGVGGDIPVPIPIYDDGELVGYEKNSRGGDYMTKIEESAPRILAEGSGGIYVRESELETAIHFIEKELIEERLPLSNSYNPMIGYLLAASILSFIVLMKYMKP